MNQKPSISYPLQFFILLGLLGVFIAISALVVPFLGSFLLHVPLMDVLPAMNKPENANAARALNTLASFIAFFMPALVLARLLGRRPFTQLGFNTRASSKQVMLIIVITFASMLLSGALGELNERIPLPASWYAAAKKLEEAYKAAMLTMAAMRSLPEYFIVLLVLAAFPAVFEEVLFRGGFQQALVGWTKNKWAGIIITSILFSAIHFSYFGFLPRVALGIVLGLVFHTSRNIWLNIFLHFLNNAVVVTQLYVVTRQGKSIEKTMDESMPIWWGLVAVILLIVFFRMFKRESARIAGAETSQVHTENILS